MALFRVECETAAVTFNPSSATNQIILSGLQAEITTADIISISNGNTNAKIFDREVPGGVATLIWDIPTQEARITIEPATIVSLMDASDVIRVYIDYPDKLIPQRVDNIQVGMHGETQMVSIPTSIGAGYASGDNIGGIGTISAMCRYDQGVVNLTDVSIWSEDNQVFTGCIDFWCISPSGTYTDNAAQVMTGDEAFWLNSIQFSNADFRGTGVGAAAIQRMTKNLSTGMKLQNLSGGQDIYFTVCIVPATGSPNPNWTSVSGLHVTFGYQKY